MRKMKCWIIVMLIGVVQLSVYAQNNITVTGKVIDQALNEGLIGVTVAVKGQESKIATMTDVDGAFTLRVNSENDVLVFTFIGYKQESVTVGTKRDFLISMQENTLDLEEVVVVGYGTQKKGSLSGAISAIRADELTRTTSTTTAGALVGKVPGISARQTDGRPGSSATIQIRNMGTPLYVIDGIQSEEGQFNNIDVNDIESITVLKDASAAIYGLKAANGVVLVTTKTGKRGEKNQINANFYYGIQNFMRYPEVANASEFYEGRMQADLNHWGSTNRTMDELNLWKQGQGDYKSMDWQKFIVNENAPIFYGNVSASGGSDKINYYFALAHTNQEAMINGFNFERTNIQSNVEANITKDLKVGTRISGRIEERHNVGVPGLDDYWQPYYAMFQNWPTQQAYANGNPNYVNNTRNNATGAAIFDKNQTGYTDDVWKVASANIFAEYTTPLPGLKARVSYNYWIARNDQEQFEYTYKVYDYDKATDSYLESWGNQNPWRRRVKEEKVEQTFQAQLNYDNTFNEKHHFSGVLGVETFERNRDYLLYNTNPTNNYIPLTNNYTDLTGIETIMAESARAGFIFRGAYDYASKYFVEFSGRYDGSYLFRPGHRWGFFPAVSGAWRLSEEPFMAGLNDKISLSNLKLRASWGQMGDDQVLNTDNVLEDIVPAFSYLNGYTYGGTDAGNAVLNGTTTTGIMYRGQPITTLSWIKSTLVNIGLDFGFLQNRLNGTFDIFQRKRTGLPASRYDVLVPVEVGYDLPQENLKSDYHQGVEFSLNWNDQVEDFGYSLGFNTTIARKKDGDSYKPRFGSSWNEYRNSTENRWANINWGYQVVGRFKDYEEIQNYKIDNDGQGNATMLPGDLIYKDVNKDGVINALDERPIGYGAGQLPYVNFGLMTSFEWKGFDLKADFAAATAQTYHMSWEVAYPFQGDGNSTRYLLTDAWHRADPTDANSDWIAGYFPATRYAGDNVSFNRYSDFWVHNTYYIKLRTLELGYTLPKKVTSKFYVNRLRFYVNAYNLFSIDNLSKYQLDPEISSNSALVTPNLRTISFGFNLNF
ncbi:MAG: TonB-dependent receptor [Prevotella sp.]|jgi:TonB-linked SusC/RagA family outer membrane protein|nr:TonB-dependent receptor [Prevotella sp.]